MRTTKSARGGPRHRPPAYYRYQEANPTVTLRLTRAERDRLSLEAQKFGMPVSSLLKTKLGVKTPAYLMRARAAGYEEALRRFKATYLCDVCHAPIAIDPNNARLIKLVREFLDGAGWGHKACHNR